MSMGSEADARPSGVPAQREPTDLAADDGADVLPRAWARAVRTGARAARVGRHLGRAFMVVVGPRSSATPPTSCSTASSASDSRRHHQGAGDRPPSSHGQGQLAAMLSGMNLSPAIGVDFVAMGRVLGLAALVYLWARSFSWLQGFIDGRRHAAHHVRHAPRRRREARRDCRLATSTATRTATC